MDDRVPLSGYGAGAPRARQHVMALAMNYDVRLYTAGNEGLDDELQAFGIQGVDTMIDLPAAPVAIVCSRPNNVAAALEWQTHMPGSALIYDAEARFSARPETRWSLVDRDSSGRLSDRDDWQRWIGMERDLCKHADVVISISESEAEWFRRRMVETFVISPIGPVAPVEVAPPTSRDGVVFVSSWDAGIESPNGDALHWLSTSVLPAAPRRFDVQITGSGLPAADTARPSEFKMLGQVDDVDALLLSARVAIAPVRFGAGVKQKVVDSLLTATPTVTTSRGAEGLPPVWRQQLVITDDPADFACAIDTLLRDDEAWSSMQRSMVECSRRWNPADASRVWDAAVQRAAALRSTHPRFLPALGEAHR